MMMMMQKSSAQALTRAQRGVVCKGMGPSSARSVAASRQASILPQVSTAEGAGGREKVPDVSAPHPTAIY